MTARIAIYIEVYDGEWIFITPYEVSIIGIPCPKFGTSTWEKYRWSNFIGSNHPVFVMLTGHNNLDKIIQPIDPKYVDLAPILSETTQEDLDQMKAGGAEISALSAIDLNAFLEKDYWDQAIFPTERANYTLKYSDILEDSEKWIALSKSLLEMFEKARMIIWIIDW